MLLVSPVALVTLAALNAILTAWATVHVVFSRRASSHSATAPVPFPNGMVYAAFPCPVPVCILCRDEPLPGIPAIKVIHEGTFGTAGAGDWESMLARWSIRS